MVKRLIASAVLALMLVPFVSPTFAQPQGRAPDGVAALEAQLARLKAQTRELEQRLKMAQSGGKQSERARPGAGQGRGRRGPAFGRGAGRGHRGPAAWRR